MKQIFQFFIIALFLSYPVISHAQSQPEPQELTPKQVELCNKYPYLCDGGPGCEDEDESQEINRLDQFNTIENMKYTPQPPLPTED